MKKKRLTAVLAAALAVSLLGASPALAAESSDTSETTVKSYLTGLDVAMKVLKKIEDIAFSHLTSKDVVRHPLVQQIVQAYDVYDKNINEKKQKAAKTRTHRG